MAEDDITQSIHRYEPQLRRGERLADRFVVIQFLARGGMGEVYEVADTHLQGKHCALKTLRPETAADPQVRQSFEREVLLAREVNHPSVCPTFDIFRIERADGPVLFLTMKLLHGESLGARLKRLGKLDPALARDVARQMSEGLDAAHRAGVIHRDFKPGNVMLEGVGVGVQAAITDFGLSRLYEEDSTLQQGGGISGTIGYIAPEVLEGRIASPASDVYAFGVVLHEMLMGRKPHEKNLGEGLPQEWKAAVRGCLERDPARRFQSAGEAFAVVEPPSAQSQTEPFRKPVSRRVVLWASGAGAVVAATWLGWPKINTLLHPLPEQRFVALMAWPPDSAGESTRPLLRIVLDAISNRLTRAEATVKKFTVIAPGAAGQPVPKALADVAGSMGANLVLGASVGAAKSGYQLVLRVFDAMNGAVLRKQESRFAFGEVNRLADRASILAAELLDIPQSGAGLKDQDEITKLPPEAYRTFGEAEDSRSQPNDRGLDEAINKYQKVLESEPRFALGFAELSLAYSRQYQIGHDRAFLSLAESNGAMALHYNQQSAKGTLAVAVCYLEAGKTQEAVNGFARALQLDPGNPQILLYKARIYRDLAEMSEEESVYREIIRYRPNYWPGYNELGNCLFHQTRYQEAADAFAEAAALAPRVALPLTNQAVMYFALNRYQDAEGAFRRSLELAPSELAYSNLGTIVFMKGNYQGAIDNYKKALDLNPKSHRAWRNLADSYAMLGDSRREQESYARAAETLADSLRVNPKPGSNWATLAFYHAKLGRRSDAEAELKTADEHGLDSRARFTKAQALAVLGLTEEALALVLDCIDHGLSSLDVDLALDLKQVRADPRYRRHIASSAK